MPAKKIKNKNETIQVSFIPEQGEGVSGISSSWKRLLLAVLIALVAVLGGAAVYLRLTAKKLSDRTKARRVEIGGIESRLKQTEEEVKQTGNIGQLAGLARSALQNHIAAEKILEIVAASTVPEVVINQFSSDANGTVVLSARGATFEAIMRQLLVWRVHPQIVDMRASAITTAVNKLGEVEGVDVSATLTLAPDVLKWKP